MDKTTIELTLDELMQVVELANTETMEEDENQLEEIGQSGEGDGSASEQWAEEELRKFVESIEMDRDEGTNMGPWEEEVTVDTVNLDEERDMKKEQWVEWGKSGYEKAPSGEETGIYDSDGNEVVLWEDAWLHNVKNLDLTEYMPAIEPEGSAVSGAVAGPSGVVGTPPTAGVVFEVYPDMERRPDIEIVAEVKGLPEVVVRPKRKWASRWDIAPPITQPEKKISTGAQQELEGPPALERADGVMGPESPYCDIRTEEVASRLCAIRNGTSWYRRGRCEQFEVDIPALNEFPLDGGDFASIFRLVVRV